MWCVRPGKNKKGWKQLKKSVLTSFQVLQYTTHVPMVGTFFCSQFTLPLCHTLFSRDDVICDDAFSPLTLKPKPKQEASPKLQPKQRRRNTRRLSYRNNLLRNDFTLPKEAFDENNPSEVATKTPYSEQPPYECYWCCKPRDSYRPIIVPATPKPVTEEAFSWTPYPPATRPTVSPVAVWKPGKIPHANTRRGSSFL